MPALLVGGVIFVATGVADEVLWQLILGSSMLGAYSGLSQG